MDTKIKQAIAKHVEPQTGQPFPIVCVTPYEFEGKKFNQGDISYKSWGRPMPDGWRKATASDIENYISR